MSFLLRSTFILSLTHFLHVDTRGREQKKKKEKENKEETTVVTFISPEFA